MWECDDSEENEGKQADWKRLYFQSMLNSLLSLLVVSVAQLVARWTHDRKVVGSIPTNAVCFTVVR